MTHSLSSTARPVALGTHTQQGQGRTQGTHTCTLAFAPTHTLAKKKESTMSQMLSLVKPLKMVWKVQALVARRAVAQHTDQAPMGSGANTSPAGTGRVCVSVCACARVCMHVRVPVPVAVSVPVPVPQPVSMIARACMRKRVWYVHMH